MEKPSATRSFGILAPTVKSTVAVSLAVPLISAVTVSAAFAWVELNVVVNTPAALVVPDTVPK